MVGTKTKDERQRSKKRSEQYVRHAKYLLRVAERDLVTAEGYLISVRGLHKLKTKLNRLGAAY